MTSNRDWTTPAELRGKAKRLWDRGAMLASLVTGEPLFPRRHADSRPHIGAACRLFR